MKPIDFINTVNLIAQTENFPVDHILFGGDHLGPFPWRNESSQSAMAKAEMMVREYAKAGFKKIHLDTSMPCQDDGSPTDFDKRIVAKRSAKLCKAVESENSHNNSDKPVYIIGTEVPNPGGQTVNEGAVQVTSVDDLSETISIHKQEFYKEGLHEAWERVLAVVVQPGVEFSDKEIIKYDRSKTLELKKYIQEIPLIVYEAHSTDYQLPMSLQEMVEDHFAILKVGPALTFAFREALLSLELIEKELESKLENERSNLWCVLDELMIEKPEYWKNYISGNDNESRLERKFGFSDRIRYYWNYPVVQKSIKTLIVNLSKLEIPLTLISQFFPNQFNKIQDNKIRSIPDELITDHISPVLDGYSLACNAK